MRPAVILSVALLNLLGVQAEARRNRPTPGTSTNPQDTALGARGEERSNPVDHFGPGKDQSRPKGKGENDKLPAWLVQRAKDYVQKPGLSTHEFWEKWTPRWHSNAIEKNENTMYLAEWGCCPEKTEEPGCCPEITHRLLTSSVFEAANFVQKSAEEVSKSKGDTDLPISDWLACTNDLAALAMRNGLGTDPYWTPEDVNKLWATMEYLSGLLLFYSKHSDREAELERAKSTILSIPNLTEEMREKLGQVKLPTEEKTLADFKEEWKKILDQKYPHLRLFHLDQPEKECVTRAKARETKLDAFQEWQRRRPEWDEFMSYPWKKVPR